MTSKNNNRQVLQTDINLIYENIMSNKDCIDNSSSPISIEDLPSWYDEKLFKLGQDYARRNLALIAFSSVMGLLTVFTVPDIEILLYTKNSSSPCAAFKRYLQTEIHIHTLYLDNINDPDSNWWKSLNTIRWKHATVAKKAEKDNIKFSKFNLTLTQFGFIGYVLLKSKEIGFTNELEGREGYAHLWRLIGYLIGVPDEMNLCRNNDAETTALLDKILNDYYVNQIKNRSESCEHMIKSVIHGFWYIDTSANYDVFMRLWYELNGLKYERPMSLYSRLTYMQQKTIFYLLGIPYIKHPIRWALNYLTHTTIWIAEYFPILGWIKFGRKNTQISVYPVSFESRKN